MKRLFAVLFCVSVFLPVVYGQQKQWVEDYTVCVGTKTPVLVGGKEPTRKYYAVGNWSPTYVVFHATYPITQADIQATASLTIGTIKKGGGIPLAPYTDSGSDLNKWVDDFNIYTSSWWVLLSSASAPADTTAIKANVTYRQRK